MTKAPLVFRVAFSTPWFEIEESVPAIPGQLPYYRITGPDGVIMLPLTHGGDIVMVRQFRPNLGRETLELPAGAVEPGEGVVEAARREIAEETAHGCGDVLVLGPGRLHLNRTTHVEYFCLAMDAVPFSSTTEDGMTMEVVGRREFRRLLQEDRIEQIAAVCFVGLGPIKLGVDLLIDPIDTIRGRVADWIRNNGSA